MTSAVFRLIYAQHTKIHSNSIFVRGVFSPGCLALRNTGAGEADGRCGKGNRTMADSREVMNIRQASQYLGVSPDTLYKYVGEQKIPAFKLGNRWRFKKSKLDQWMEEKSNQMEDRVGKKKAKAAVKAAGQL
jgi:excisionase family DNA binding protein